MGKGKGRGGDKDSATGSNDDRTRGHTVRACGRNQEEGTGGIGGFHEPGGEGEDDPKAQRTERGEEALVTATGVEEEHHTGELGQMDGV